MLCFFFIVTIIMAVIIMVIILLITIITIIIILIIICVAELVFKPLCIDCLVCLIIVHHFLFNVKNLLF